MPPSTFTWQVAKPDSTPSTVDCKPRALLTIPQCSLLHRKRNTTWVGPKMVLGDPLFLVFVSSCDPLPLCVGRT